MMLTKAEVAQKVAGDCGFMKGEATEIVEKLLEIIKERLSAGEDVLVSGFGKWSVKSKHARAEVGILKQESRLSWMPEKWSRGNTRPC
jgi:nucleoid DNA-binding protein